jgi:hypothetical protein
LKKKTQQLKFRNVTDIEWNEKRSEREREKKNVQRNKCATKEIPEWDEKQKRRKMNSSRLGKRESSKECQRDIWEEEAREWKETNNEEGF